MYHNLNILEDFQIQKEVWICLKRQELNSAGGIWI